jgi:glucose-6-phosphate isomerase
MSYSGGGTGLFHFLVLFQLTHNKPVQVFRISSLAGGRFSTMSMKGDSIFVSFGQRDSSVIVEKFLLETNKLVSLKRK